MPVADCVLSGSVSGIYWEYSAWLAIFITSIIVAAIFFVLGIFWDKGKVRS